MKKGEGAQVDKPEIPDWRWTRFRERAAIFEHVSAR
jgi:hypothetical protein